MSAISLVGISGKELRWVREKAGLSRSQLSSMLERNGEEILRGVSTKSLERYETLPEVPALYAQQYRKVIGADIFDELLQQARKASLSGELGGTIRREYPRMKRKKSAE